MAIKLTANENAILVEVLHHFDRESRWPERRQFRVQHEDAWDTLERLRRNGMLDDLNGCYSITRWSLPLIESTEASRIRGALGRLLDSLAAEWRQNPKEDTLVMLPAITAASSLPEADVRRAADLGAALGFAFRWIPSGGKFMLQERILTDARDFAATAGEPMPVSEIKIRGLRGIRDGHLKKLTRLSVLVGINGCGKSTVLDALHIACNADVDQAIMDVMIRHGGDGRTVDKWLFFRSDPRPGFTLIATATNGRAAARDIDAQRVEFVVGKKGRGPIATVDSAQFPGVATQPPQPLPGLDWDSALFDASAPGLLQNEMALLERVDAAGRRTELGPMLADVSRGDLRAIEFGTVDLVPSLKVAKSTNHLVPLAHSGDGIRNLVRLVLQLIAEIANLVLLEEPEAHLHPRAMEVVARAIVATAKRGTQIVLTTHSLEFLGYLNAAVDEEFRNEFSLFRLSLRDGELLSRRYGGDELQDALHDLGEDLR